LSATRALEQIRNQIRQIEQATAMLRQNPLQLSPELSQSIQEARALFQTAQGIAFDIDSLSEDLRTLYPETWEAFDLDQILGQSDQWMAESRASLERAMQAEARAAASIERAQGAYRSGAAIFGGKRRPNRRHPGRQSIAGRQRRATH
jgi:P-type conjugative transfer protein TrbJ